MDIFASKYALYTNAGGLRSYRMTACVFTYVTALITRTCVIMYACGWVNASEEARRAWKCVREKCLGGSESKTGREA